MKILVTGATGQLGAKVVDALLTAVPADQLAVSVREPEKAKHLSSRGVEVRYGDFDRPDSLDAAFAGVDRLLIISSQGDNDTRIRQHLNAISAAERAGVGFIAYTSVVKAEDTPLLLAPVHHATEEAIRKTGIPYSFLRNNWYMENEAGLLQGILSGAPLVTSAGAAKVGWAARADYAQAAAAVIAGSCHENTVYELSGPPITHEELAKVIGTVLNREVQVQQVDDAAYAGIMQAAGVPDAFIPLLTGIQAGIREGALDIESGALQKLLGRPLTPLSDVIRELVNGMKS
ncbi:SDR family oxidoreductase [Paenibacillus rigui]|uniref:NAD(P)-dependent oxidoreductase n=1 Tax=Paenibacillus rigui TaxID=554312 RepID=A0A229URR1_9BACL|nr:SDR family oxidoreductase [Paenibacillus rigui]OXM86206.1 NAD(P)-dependent oxidoreductase [Paenibacillus rigui]